MLQLLSLLILLVSCTHSYAALEEKLKHISANDNYIWGVTETNQAVLCDRPCKDWRPMGLHLIKQLDVDDEDVWAVDTGGFIFQRPVDGSGDWTFYFHIPGGSGKVKHISVSGNGYIWAITVDGGIYKCRKPCTGFWIIVPGKLKQIDGGRSSVYGVADDRTIWQRPVDGHGEWREVDGELDSITVSPTSDHIFGIAASGSVWHCTEPCHGDWTGMAGKLNQCDVTDGELYGVTHGNNDEVQYYLWDL